MARISGLLYSGKEYKRNITKRTREIVSGDEIREINLEEIGVAENLERIHFCKAPIEKISLEHINKCPNLTRLSITLSNKVDYKVLSENETIKNLLINIDGFVDDPLSGLPQNLETLWLMTNERVTIDLRNLPKNIRTLNISAPVKDVSLLPLREYKIENLNLENMQWQEIELPDFGLEELKNLNIANCRFDTFFTHRLMSSKKLQNVCFRNSHWNYLYLDGLTELTDLKRLTIDDTKGCYIDSENISKIKNMGLKHYKDYISTA